MPDALSILMGMNSPSNAAATYPASTFTGKRNNARTATLARMLGMPSLDDGSISEEELAQAEGEQSAAKQAEEEAKAVRSTYPARVTGEYGLQQEQLKSKSAQDVARINAERVATERETAREFTAGQNDLNRTAMADRLATTQNGLTQRNENTQAGQMGRQNSHAIDQRIQLLRTGKMNAPKPAGLMGWMTGQNKVNESEAARLEGVKQAALTYLNVPPDQVEAAVAQNETDATPDEQQEMLGIIRELQGR